MRAGFGMAQCLFYQHFDGFVIQYVARVVRQPVLAAQCVRVERDISHDAQFGKLAAQRTHGSLHQAFGVVGFLRVGGFVLGDDRKQRQHGNAQLHGAFGGFEQQIQALALNAAHGRNFLLAVFAFQHEHGVNQIVGSQGVFAHQAAGKIVAAHTAHAGQGKVSRWEVHGVFFRESIMSINEKAACNRFECLSGIGCRLLFIVRARRGSYRP